MVLFGKRNAVATYFGREKGEAQGEWLLLLNELIRLSLERGCQNLHLGRGSYDAKAIAGADIEPLRRRVA